MPQSSFNPLARARLHPITCDKPAVNFFEGALLGNGGLGVVVTTRPDSLAIRFGHNNVWDIRLSERNADQIGTFQETFNRIKAIPETYATLSQDADYAAFIKIMESNYAKRHPHPYPCGSLILSWDRRRAEVIGHRLDIASGLCEVYFLREDQKFTAQIFVSMAADQVWLRTVDADGQPIAAPFNRIRLLPNPNAAVPPFGLTLPDPQLPEPQTPPTIHSEMITFRQTLPYLEADQYNAVTGHSKDRAFQLTVRTNATLDRRTFTNWHDQREEMDVMERAIIESEPFVAVVQLDEGLAAALPMAYVSLPIPSQMTFNASYAETQNEWDVYWQQSGIALADEFLEQSWYWNLYFFNCAVKPGINAPGLFANWSYRTVGTAWHGDYYMNYNTQQPFWLSFSSNHVDKHLAYVELVERLLPLAQYWAAHYYELPGANFPHSAYPVDMNIPPYPSPTWAWEMCETPWTVQSLWWHYLYTQDTEFLRQRAFPLLKEAARFMASYMQRPETHGPQWGDDHYHIFPTVSPELYNGLLPGFRKNHDCLVDLTLTKFLFKAYLKACEKLEIRVSEGELCQAVETLLAHFPVYSTVLSAHGEVFVSVPGENAEVVYNTPNAMMTVFPGEEHGLHSDTTILAIARNTYQNQQIEGGNDVVFQNLQAARLGLLDIEKFKRQLRYCLLPNGTSTNMVLQTGGRFDDEWEYDFMAHVGVWFENLAVPVVLNECLFQSYSGTMRFFPNWRGDAEFHSLRAVGGFLVSASQKHGQVEWITIRSEAGQPFVLINPWQAPLLISTTGTDSVSSEETVTVNTQPDVSYVISRKPD